MGKLYSNERVVIRDPQKSYGGNNISYCDSPVVYTPIVPISEGELLWDSPSALWNGVNWYINSGELKLNVNSESDWYNNFRPSYIRITNISDINDYGSGWHDELNINDTIIGSILNSSLSTSNISVNLSDNLESIELNIYWSNDRLPANSITITNIEFMNNGTWLSYLYELPEGHEESEGGESGEGGE